MTREEAWDLEDLEFEAELAREANPDLRAGQALFNVLHEHDPQLARAVTASDIDPFHLDSRIEPFKEWLAHRLEERAALPAGEIGCHTPITPTLFLGVPPPGAEVQLASDLAEAVAIIDSGGTAVLPEGSWKPRRRS